ncbi:MAG TPA: hypothetical protein VG322_01715 [Candidatus Acidoferrales bacterium]|jgi:hypothetical protein|nr:hypothetical protein [Candidatus Acidoferrales bacterium]
MMASVALLSAALCGTFGATSLRAQENSIPHTSGPNDDAQPDTKSDNSSERAMTKLRLHVTGNNGKAIDNASVYVRYNKPGGFLRKEKLAELDLKTNGEGDVKVPPVPQGKILVQVIATGWHTYGKWYEINKDEDSIEIKLEPPTKWY